MSELASLIAAAAANVAAGNPGFPIPNANFPSSPISTVPRETLNNAAPNVSQQQIMTAAAGSVIGFGYGRCRVGLSVLFPIVSSGALLIPGFVGKGPIDAIEAVELDNAALVSGVTHTDYTGAPGQAVNAALQAAWLAAGKAYSDDMPGVAYTVVRIPSGAGYRFGNVTVTARMLKVYDSRLDSTNGGTGSHRLADSTTWEWSQNPVLALAHFLSTAGFGPEEELDWSTVADCADIADEVLESTQTRRQVGIFFDRQQSVEAIEETLRSYAGVFIVREDDVVRFVADAPGASVYDFTNTASSVYDLLLLEGGTDHLLFEGSTDRVLLEPLTSATGAVNYLLDSLQIKCDGRGDSPTVVTIRYTDTSQSPWGTQEVTVKAAGVDAGTAAWIESVVDWPGCQSAGMAYREAVRRVNEFALADLSARLIGTDDVLRVRRGDIVTLTDSEGFSRKPFRATDVFPNGPGRWSVALTEYQDGLYSDTVYTGPVIDDSDFPLPTDPPTVTGLTATEEPFLEQFAVTATQARLSWTAPVWPFLRDYWVVGSIGGVKQFELVALPSGAATDEAVTPKLRPGELYSFGVYVRSTVATGAGAFVGLRPVGKSSPPSDVASLVGFSVGGDVFLQWPEATDGDQIHIRYELRYSTTGGTWPSASTIDKIAALRKTVTGVPAGTWRFWVKAIDSIGQESTNAAYCDLVVTNTGAYNVTEIAFIAPTVVNMTRDDIVSQTEPRWVTDVGDVLGYGHVDTNDATGVWVDANVLLADLFITPTAASSSSWTSETYDHGSIVSANWAATLPYRALIGGVDFTLWLSDDDYAWTAYPSGVALGIAARYAFIELKNNVDSPPTTDVFAVDGYGLLQIVQEGAGALRPTAVTTETITPDTTVTVVIDGQTIKLAGLAV